MLVPFLSFANMFQALLSCVRVGTTASPAVLDPFPFHHLRALAPLASRSHFSSTSFLPGTCKHVYVFASWKEITSLQHRPPAPLPPFLKWMSSYWFTSHFPFSSETWSFHWNPSQFTRFLNSANICLDFPGELLASWSSLLLDVAISQASVLSLPCLTSCVVSH